MTATDELSKDSNVNAKASNSTGHNCPIFEKKKFFQKWAVMPGRIAHFFAITILTNIF